MSSRHWAVGCGLLAGPALGVALARSRHSSWARTAQQGAPRRTDSEETILATAHTAKITLVVAAVTARCNGLRSALPMLAAGSIFVIGLSSLVSKPKKQTVLELRKEETTPSNTESNNKTNWYHNNREYFWMAGGIIIGVVAL
eukprot:SAG31_NODE_27207_length_429_cov_6.357576_1_plen_142_part_11